MHTQFVYTYHKKENWMANKNLILHENLCDIKNIIMSFISNTIIPCRTVFSDSRENDCISNIFSLKINNNLLHPVVPN